MNEAAHTPTRQLVVIGGGGFAREVIWLAREATRPWQVIACLDDAEDAQGRMLADVPVVGRVDDWTRFEDASFVVGIGSPRARKAIVDRMSAGAPRFATLIHRSVHMSAYIDVAEGAMITAGCVLTTQITIGRHVIVNINSTVGHDTIMEDFCTVAPIVAVSGNVHLCFGSEVGTGASLRQGVTIGRGAMVGMGAVVTKDVEPRHLVVGSPARTVRELPAI